MYVSGTVKGPSVKLNAKPKAKAHVEQQVSLPQDSYDRDDGKDKFSSKIMKAIPNVLGVVAAVGGYALASQGGMAGVAATAPMAAVASLSGLAMLSNGADSGIAPGGAVMALVGLGVAAGIATLGAAGGLVAGIAGAVTVGSGVAFLGTVMQEKMAEKN